MNDFFRDYVKRFLSSDQKQIKTNESKEQNYKENEMRKSVKPKMKKVNIFDKLKFNKLKSRLKPKNINSRFSGTSNFKIDEWLRTKENLKNNDDSKFNNNSKAFNDDSKFNNSSKSFNNESKSKSNQNLNIEKLKEAALVVTAVVLIGIGYVNFSGNKSPIETIDKVAKSTNNIGDVELVSSKAVLVDNEDEIQNVDNNSNQNSDKESSNSSQQTVSKEENKDKSQQLSNSEENTYNNQQQAVVENEAINKNETEKKSNVSTENNKNEEKSNSESSALVNSTENKDDKATNKENIKEDESNTSQNYFAGLKLERNDMYSKSLETYQKIVDSSTISGEQKSIAIKEIEKINQSKNSISVAEELIKLKGFEDVVIYTNDDSISVIVKVATLSNTQVAQIQNIVSRELGVEVSKINISNKK